MYDILNSFTATQSTGAEPQNVTADTNSANILNLAKTGLRITGDQGPYLILKCTERAVEGTSITVQLRTADNVDMSTDNVIVSTWTFSAAVLAAAVTSGNPLINQQLPHYKYRQYLALYFDTDDTEAKFIGYLSDTPEPAEAPSATT